MLPEIRLQGTIPSIAHLDQYAGVWAIEESRAQFLIQKANNLDLSAHVAEQQQQTAEAATNFGYETVPGHSGGNVAIVSVSGVMTKYGSSFSNGGSTLRARKALRNANNDPNVTAILLYMETPGGSVAGTKELADEVAAIAKQKPLWAYCEDLCASAGYWVASHASKVYANEMAMIGSIGTFMVIHDYAQMFAEDGVKVHVIRAGDFKGAGTPGTEVTDEHLTEWQSKVNQLNAFFTAGVQRQRGFTATQIKDLADGRIHIGKSAVDLGLIDGVQSLDKTLAALSKQKKPSGASASVPEELLAEEPTMTTDNPSSSDKPQTPVAATYKEIVAGCAGCDPQSNGDDARFVADCLAQERTLAQAQTHWMQTLNARIEAREEEAEKARAEAAKQQSTKGLKSLEDGNGKSTDANSGDAIADWKAIVAENMKACGGDRSAAMRKSVLENAEAYDAYLAAYNAAHPSPEQMMRRRKTTAV